MTRRTVDYAAAGRDLHFYTTQKISGRRSRTPEGYLLIEGVPLARTGTMLYGPDETPIPGGPDGLVYIERTPEEVFRPETIASANGKAIVNDHPSEDVTPSNWRNLSLGVIMNPRQGTGIEDDFLIGDLLVQDQRGIDLIESGKVELSMGYDAGYAQTGPGRGRQKDIIYNHVALVDKGRCGPRCSIGDRVYLQEKPMPKTATRVVDQRGVLARARDRLLGAVRAGKTVDEEMLEETLGDAESEEVAEGREPSIVINNHHHAAGDAEVSEKEDEDKKTEDKIRRMIADAMKPVLDALDARLKARDEKEDEDDKKKKAEDEEREKKETEDNEKILGALEFEAPPGTNDRARKARDSAFLVDSFQQTVALAEVLAPGIRVPTFDSREAPAKSLDTICNLRRTALDHAYGADVRVRQLIDQMAPRGHKTLDCTALRPVFLGAAELKKTINNAGGTTRTNDTVLRPGGAVGGATRSIADVNKRNREYYSKQAAS